MCRPVCKKILSGVRIRTRRCVRIGNYLGNRVRNARKVLAIVM
jgi:hypothetical protein